MLLYRKGFEVEKYEGGHMQIGKGWGQRDIPSPLAGGE